jgi:hypothetical protein
MQTEKKVLAGNLIKIKNKNKKKFSNAKDDYYAIWVEDANGKNERCLLFTDEELNRIRTRSSKNTEDHISLDSKINSDKVVFSRLIPVKNKNRRPFSNTHYLAIWIDGEETSKCFLMTENEIKKAEYRAFRNREDLTKKNWLTDLLD